MSKSYLIKFKARKTTLPLTKRASATLSSWQLQARYLVNCRAKPLQISRFLSCKREMKAMELRQKRLLLSWNLGQLHSKKFVFCSHILAYWRWLSRACLSLMQMKLCWRPDAATSFWKETSTSTLKRITTTKIKTGSSLFEQTRKLLLCKELLRMEWSFRFQSWM